MEDQHSRDELIKKEILDQLCWEGRVDTSKIDVNVDQGEVTLAGEVPTYDDLSATRDAIRRIEGVRDVSGSLRVKYVTPPFLPDDQGLRARVEHILSWETALDENSIKVTVFEAIVVLEGVVDAYWKRSLAEKRISGIRGILDVVNKLSVVPSRRVSDELIAKDIMASFEADVFLDAKKITVEVDDGSVRLSGTVPSWTARRGAETTAAYTVGVTRVINELEVED